MDKCRDTDSDDSEGNQEDAAPAPRPLVRREESEEEEAEEEAALSPPIVGQPVNDAENQRQQVLSHFSAEEWGRHKGATSVCNESLGLRRSGEMTAT